MTTEFPLCKDFFFYFTDRMVYHVVATNPLSRILSSFLLPCDSYSGCASGLRLTDIKPPGQRKSVFIGSVLH